MRPWRERAALAAWGFIAKRPVLYALATRLGVRVLEWMAGERKSIRKLPFAGGWTDTRELPAPVGRTFRELYRAQRSHT